MAERWLPCPGRSGYEVSDQGNVRSLDRVVTISDKRGYSYQRLFPGCVLKPTPLKCRNTTYRSVKVSFGRRNCRPTKVAVLVLEAFVGPKPFPGAVARHLDDDQQNDRLSNLAWGSRTQNLEDAYRNGRRNQSANKAPLRKEK